MLKELIRPVLEEAQQGGSRLGVNVIWCVGASCYSGGWRGEGVRFAVKEWG